MSLQISASKVYTPTVTGTSVTAVTAQRARAGVTPRSSAVRRWGRYCSPATTPPGTSRNGQSYRTQHTTPAAVVIRVRSTEPRSSMIRHTTKRFVARFVTVTSPTSGVVSVPRCTTVQITGGTEGQTFWYRFQTKFDATFPQNHASLGWGTTNQWHGSGGYRFSARRLVCGQNQRLLVAPH